MVFNGWLWLFCLLLRLHYMGHSFAMSLAAWALGLTRNFLFCNLTTRKIIVCWLTSRDLIQMEDGDFS